MRPMNKKIVKNVKYDLYDVINSQLIQIIIIWKENMVFRTVNEKGAFPNNYKEDVFAANNIDDF